MYEDIYLLPSREKVDSLGYGWQNCTSEMALSYLVFGNEVAVIYEMKEREWGSSCVGYRYAFKPSELNRTI